MGLIAQKELQKIFNFCCANNWEHYHLWFEHWEPALLIIDEQVIIYEGNHKYIIYQENDNNKTEMYIYKIDPEGNLIGNVNPKRLFFNRKLFDFSQTNREKIVNRVKTILVFQ